MKDIKNFALLTGICWFSIILLSFVGNIVEKSGLIPNLAANSSLVIGIKIVFFTLFLTAAFSSVPLFVRLFIILASAGTPDNFLKKLKVYEFRAVCVIWAVWLAGLAMALPAMIAACFFCS
jgi:hypothetical protein